MSGVEDRVVNMTFNNAAFEQKIAATMGSLDKLKSSLDFSKAKSGMSDISSAASGFNMTGMASAVEGVSAKFIALSTIAITALSTVVSHAISAGVNLAKSLSLDQVIGGFKEYETNMNSIQTIMANTSADATTLEDVNGALQKLNTYSDQTIYNFGEMARNIGTFTAAGVNLDTSVNSIKGIANLAAISGSNSEQASTAMYQLSQAMASGTVKLMDWNSVVNAGMGGEIFQKALFETGKSLGTIADTPIDMTFDDWTAAGNTFRGSLESGWITADVLTNTLQGFTGDLDAAQLTALGYTEEQAVEMMRLGKVGKAAATEVKTLTQLIGTVKESVGSGWSQSFGIVIGDFNEAKELFTGINSAIGGFVGKSADARNALLQGWKDMGGRSDIIEGVKNAFEALGKIVKPIQEAFQEFFPPMTAARLKNLTSDFQSFTEKLIPLDGTVYRLKAVFQGLFAALQIGWTIVKETAIFFKELWDTFTSGVDPKVLDFLLGIARSIQAVHDNLVTAGGIANFFDALLVAIQNPMHTLENLVYNIKYFLFGSDMTDGISPIFENIKEKLRELKDKFIDFFKGTDLHDNISAKVDEIKNKIMEVFNLDTFPDISGPFDRLEQRWNGLKNVLTQVTTPPEWLADILNKAQEVLGEVWTYITEWFGDLGSDVADTVEPGDFDAVVDLVNVGLLGGIALILKKFLDEGINFDIGDGFIKNIGRSLDTLTGTLKTMQNNLKADILVKIAIAIGILAASILVLSLIDSEDLTKAMAAMAVGFTQLLVVMTIMNHIASGPRDAAKIALLAISLGLMAGAMLLLGVAMKIFGTMSWEEMAKGFVGVGLGIGIIAEAMKRMPGGSQMVLQSTGLVLIGISLNLIAGAMKIFATMSWEEMGKGLVAVGGALILIAEAMKRMPKTLLATAAGLVLVGVSLNLIAASMKVFATMSWEEMGKGLVAVAVSLRLIATAMKMMPKTLLATGAGLVLVGVALNLIAASMKVFATMSWEEIGKGLAAMAGALLILAIATNAMTGAIIGAVAITLVSAAMMLLVTVMKEFAKMSLLELAKGLGGLAAVLVTLGLTASIILPMIPALLALSVAMLLLGVGFALFGLGAQAVAKAFEVIAEAGQAGVTVIIFFIDALIVRIPALIGAFATGLANLALVFLKAAPVLIRALGIVLEHILQLIIDLAPKLAETLIVLIAAGLEVLRASIPDFIKTGLELLIALLTGIRDNIGEITTLVVEIILEFVAALTAQLPAIITAAITLLTTFLTAIADNIGQVVTAGIAIVVSLLEGIAQNIGKVIVAAAELIAAFITAIGEGYLILLAAGVQLIVDFLKGISDSAEDIVIAATDVVVSFIEAIGDSVDLIIAAGTKLVIDFILGIGNAALDISNAAGDMIVEFFKGLTLQTVKIITAGKDLIITFITGIGNASEEIITAAVDTVISFMEAIQENANKMFVAAFDILIAFINGLTIAITLKMPELRAAGGRLALAIADGFTFGMASKAGGIMDALLGPIDEGIAAAKRKLDSNSPSRVFYKLGESVVDGFANAINDDLSVERSIVNFSNSAIDKFKESLVKIPTMIDGISEFAPTITPVLDLTNVRAEARKLSDIVGTSPSLATDAAYNQARLISFGTRSQEDAVNSDEPKGPTEIKFEQNNYSPESLSTADIYRQTRNQIALAKEELAVL